MARNPLCPRPGQGATPLARRDRGTPSPLLRLTHRTARQSDAELGLNPGDTHWSQPRSPVRRARRELTAYLTSDAPRR